MTVSKMTSKELKLTQPNYQDLLKTIAIITMIIDHYGLFFDSNLWLRLIGRVSMPIFCFFAGYNYYSVKIKAGSRTCLHIERYRSLLAVGIALQAIIYLYVPLFQTYNIIISICLSLILIDMIELFKFPAWLFSIFLLALVIPSYDIFDYGTIATAFVFLGYRAKQNSAYKAANLEVSKVYLGFWLFVFAFLAHATLEFDGIQNILLMVICIFLFTALSYRNFEKPVSGRFLLISRFILPIYFYHFCLFAISHYSCFS